MALNEAQQVLTALWQKRRLPQVILFYGREGMPAPRLLAWLLPQLLCQQGSACGHCFACRALAHANHDDVLSYDAAQESFGVAAASRVQNFLPLSGGTRIVVVQAAHLITRPAANKLLKILEEPPPHAHIFLTSTAYGQLLPTVTSRCFHFLLKESEDAPCRGFATQFEQLRTASSWSQRLAVIRKLREHKCELPEFLFFYEQYLNQCYRAALARGKGETQATAVRRTRLYDIKCLLQQRVSLHTQLAMESVLAASADGGQR